MDKAIRELVEKELVNIKAKTIMNEAQLLAMQTLQVAPDAAAKLNQQIQAVKTQIDFDKSYALNVENILKEDK